MRLIIGLGNPGKEYENTRHNVGWRVLDKLTENPRLAPVVDGLNFSEKKDFAAQICEINREGEKIILAKPLTFMNDSGRAVAKIANFYKIETKDIWVVADDVDLPIGTIRVRLEGTSGGHNGLKSIIDALSTENFPRVRVGISQSTEFDQKKFDNENPLDTKDFVLSKFTDREQAIMKPTIETAAEIIIDAIGKPEGLTAHTYEVE